MRHPTVTAILLSQIATFDLIKRIRPALVCQHSPHGPFSLPTPTRNAAGLGTLFTFHIDHCWQADPLVIHGRNRMILSPCTTKAKHTELHVRLVDSMAASLDSEQAEPAFLDPTEVEIFGFSRITSFRDELIESGLPEDFFVDIEGLNLETHRE